MNPSNSSRKEMLKLNLITGLVLIALCLAVIIWLIPFQIDAREADQAGMSPRFFPYISAIVLLLLATLLTAINGFKIWRHQESADEESEENEILGFGRKEVANLMFMTLGVVVFMTLMKYTGFLVSSAILLFVTMYLAGVRRYPLFLVAIVFPFAIKQLFWHLFEVYLP